MQALKSAPLETIAEESASCLAGCTLPIFLLQTSVFLYAFAFSLQAPTLPFLVKYLSGGSAAEATLQFTGAAQFLEKDKLIFKFKYLPLFRHLAS